MLYLINLLRILTLSASSTCIATSPPSSRPSSLFVWHPLPSLVLLVSLLPTIRANISLLLLHGCRGLAVRGLCQSVRLAILSGEASATASVS